MDVDGVVSEVIEEASDALETATAEPDAADASVEDDEPEQAASPAERAGHGGGRRRSDARAERRECRFHKRLRAPDTTADSGDTAPDSNRFGGD